MGNGVIEISRVGGGGSSKDILREDIWRLGGQIYAVQESRTEHSVNTYRAIDKRTASNYF